MNCLIQNATVFPFFEQTCTRATTIKTRLEFIPCFVGGWRRSCAFSDVMRVKRTGNNNLQIAFESNRSLLWYFARNHHWWRSIFIRHQIHRCGTFSLELDICAFCSFLCRNRMWPSSSSQRSVSDTLRRRHGNQLQQQWRDVVPHVSRRKLGGQGWRMCTCCCWESSSQKVECF